MPPAVKSMCSKEKRDCLCINVSAAACQGFGSGSSSAWLSPGSLRIYQCGVGSSETVILSLSFPSECCFLLLILLPNTCKFPVLPVELSVLI